jgi:hypothetical protein
MGLIEKAANTMHRQHGWFTSDSYTNAACASWGSRDNNIFERLGNLTGVNQGVPDPRLHTISRTPRWFLDSGVTVGNWINKGSIPGGLASLSIKLEFDSKWAIACFLSEHNEVQMDNLDAVGDALADLYRKPGKDWKLNRKWVYTALEVKSGFIVMSREKDTTVTLSGQGVVNVSGVPIKLNVDGFVSAASSSVEMVGLENITPFVKLCEVYDPIFAKADWRQMG